MRRVTAIALFAAAAWGLIVEGNLSAATVPPGFTESVFSGPWPDAVGITFENNGRMYVWERTGRLWFKDPGDHSLPCCSTSARRSVHGRTTGCLALRWILTFE